MATTRMTSLSLDTKENPATDNKPSLQPKRKLLKAGRAALGEIVANRGANTRSTAAVKKPLLPALVVKAAPKQEQPREEQEGSEDAVIDEEVRLPLVDSPLPLVESPLPEGVPDVDTADLGNPQLCAEYARSIYSYLRQVEAGLVIKKDFLKGCSINSRMRAVLVDWLVEVHSQFKLLQETLYMTVYLLDRYLQSEGLTLKRNQLQLIGVTAMFVASKVEEMYAPEISDFVYITDSAYSAEEIKNCELKLLRGINFNVSRPLPLHFLRRNSKAGDVDMLQHSLAKYLMEVCLQEYTLAHCPPSLLAATALLLALRLLQPEASLSSAWTSTLAYYSTYGLRQLLPLLHKMALVVQKAHDPKTAVLKAVTTKYRAKKFLQVADMPQLQGEVISKLALKDFAGL